MHLSEPLFGEIGVGATTGQTTIGLTDFTESQKLVCSPSPSPCCCATAADEATFLPTPKRANGWGGASHGSTASSTTCATSSIGALGLRGGPGEHAMNRRTRLVEYAIAARLVTRTDLGHARPAAGGLMRFKGDTPAAGR